ncbi:MAG: glutaredoxin family protein [Chloroflexota bacterium]
MAVVHVPGRKSGHIMLYALSTCGWCRKTRNLLDELGVEYDYEYVDQLDGEEKDKAIEEMSDWNPSQSFPTIVLNNKKTIVGYSEDEIREALNERAGGK